MNIAAILEEQARQCGERAAIVERRRTITFDGLDRAAATAASEMAAAGIAAGMRVLVFSPMSIGLYTTLIGLFRLGAVAVFVDPSAGRERLNRCIERVRPGAFVAVPRAHWLRLTTPVIRAIPIKASIGGGVPGARRISTTGRGSTAGVTPCTDDSPAIITFTSGSTGEPKAAVRSHGFLIAQHRALAESLALAPGDIDLCTLPIFLLANLASGVTSVIPDADLRSPGAIDPVPVIAQIAAARATRTVASPALLERLAVHATAATRPLDSFRRIYTGGAPVFPKLLDRLAEAAPNAAIVAVYGSTEAEPIAEIDRREISADDRLAMGRGAGLLAGAPVPSIRLLIVPDRWGRAVGPLEPGALEREALGHGAAGEIVVSGDHVLRGYLDGAGDTDTKIHDGGRVWHRTGDAGYLDPQGRLWLLGRCSARLDDDRGALYPFAVECAAGEVSGVVRTALVMHRGRRVLAVQAEGDSMQVRARILERLEWARLDDVIPVDRIPVDRRHNAKVEYPALMRLLERGDGRASWLRGAVAAAAIAVFLGVYVPHAGQGFIADDFEWAFSNRVRSARDAGAILTRDNGFYRPVAALSFAANEYVAGINPRPYGLTNVLLALASAAGVAFLARSAGVARGAAVFAALLWLLNVHGINMAVLWLSGRLALLVTLAATMAVGFLIRGRTAVALVWLGVALFTKEEALLLPVVGAAWLVWLRPRRGRRELLLWIVGSAVLVGGYLAARSMTGAMTPATAPPYYRFTFDPWHLLRNAVEYGDRTFTFAVIVTGILFGVLRRGAPSALDARSRAVMAACAAWVVATFTLTFFLPVRSSLYVVLPAVGAAIGAAAMVNGWWDAAAERRRRHALCALLALLALLYPILLSRTDRWVDTARLSTQVMRDLPTITAGLPEGAHIVLHDDRRHRANLGSAFGTMLDEAHLFWTGRRAHFWLEPPAPFALEANRPCAGCVAAEAELRDGRLVRRAPGPQPTR